MKVPEKQNRQRDNKGSQHIPKHVTPGGTISLSTHTTKKDNCVTRMALNTHMRMVSEHMHAPARIQAQSCYSHTPTCTVDMRKRYIKDTSCNTTSLLHVTEGRRQIIILYHIINAVPQTDGNVIYKMMHNTNISSCGICTENLFFFRELIIRLSQTIRKSYPSLSVSSHSKHQHRKWKLLSSFNQIWTQTWYSVLASVVNIFLRDIVLRRFDLVDRVCISFTNRNTLV